MSFVACQVAEYTNTDNSVRKVNGLQTNSWCSAGAALLGGLIYNLGGGGDNYGPNGLCSLARQYRDPLEVMKFCPGIMS